MLREVDKIRMQKESVKKVELVRLGLRKRVISKELPNKATVASHVADMALTATSWLTVKVWRVTSLRWNDFLKQENSTDELMSPYIRPHRCE